ncbi:MAG: hypothetical protein WC758_05270 [Candidatus Woesearchaeota archaeon]|jgi:hypothetical protein
MSEMNILDWAVAYIKYKDSVHGKIKSIDVDNSHDKVEVVFKDETKATYLCKDKLEELNVSSLKNEKVVCLNKKDNLNWLISNWETIKDKSCIFLFVNIKQSENWAINPHIHSSVTDKSALKSGLKALFESIPEAN